MRFNETTDPSLRSFLPVPAESDFPIQNLPIGIFRRDSTDEARAGVAIGDLILDLAALERAERFSDPEDYAQRPFSRRTLNHFLSMGGPTWTRARRTISRWLSGEDPLLRDDADLRESVLVEQSEVELLLPVEIGDFTDFYSSREHATNVGTMFRGPDNALMPNWLHLPVAYHGRSSSVFVSGTPVVRPAGQIKPADEPPRHGSSAQLDFELEVGLVVGRSSIPGRPIPIGKARGHAFGMLLVNDWSARDIQAWEYVPLGPFLGKNFATTISPWIVSLDALEPFQVEPPVQKPTPLPYLLVDRPSTFNIHLEVGLQTSTGADVEIVCRSNFRHLYWTIDQQIAHHTVNGCNLRSGDLLASGTISGPTVESYGSLLELTSRGVRPLRLKQGGSRAFLEDGDTVIMRGWAAGDGYRIGFGEARAQVLPNSYLTG